MKKKTGVVIAAFLGLCPLFSDIVWQENFSAGQTMEENGYKASIANPAGKVELKDGTMVFHCAPGASFHYSKALPKIRKGEVSFELNLNQGRSSKFNNLSFRIGAYGTLVYANAGARALMMYDPGKKIDKRLFPIWSNQWKKVMIRFDIDAKTLEYYVDDMYNPVYEDRDAKFIPAAETSPEISIGNYGRCGATILNSIRNLQVNDLSEKSSSGENVSSEDSAVPVVVWQEDFSKGPTMEANGYKASISNPPGKVELKDGAMVFHCAPGESFHYAKSLPKVRKGDITFELNLNQTKSPKFNSLGFRFGVYGLLVYANGGARSFMMHNSGRNFDKAIYPVWSDQWKKVMIRFDMDEKTVKYYVDDMEKPVFEDSDVKFHSSATSAPEIQIGNYGRCAGTVTNCIRNIKIIAVPEKEIGKVVWTDDFSKGPTMEANGYRKVADNGKDKAEIRDGVMYYRCETSPYKGSKFEKKIPFVTKGELSFDMMVNAEKSTNYTHLSLTVTLYGTLMICPHGSNKFIQRYHPGTQRNDNLAPTNNGEWYRVAIRFDLNKRTAEYYVNDMENPVFTDEYFPFNMNAAFDSNLMIGNYGLAPGGILNGLKNFKLKDLSVGDPDTERLVWKEDFSKGSTMESNGFKTVQKNPADKVVVKNNTMEFTCTPGAHKGSHFVKEMPFLRKGELSFWLKVNAKKISKNQYNQLSLMVYLYESLMLCPHGNPGTLHRYHPGKNNNAVIAPLKDGEWHKVMLRYDIDAKTVQYFVDDMRKPVFEDKDFPFNMAAVQRSRMRIGNYGLSVGTVTHQIRDIELRRLEEKSDNKKSKTEGIVLISGLSTGTYDMKSMLDVNGEKISNFNMETFAINEFVTNRFQYEKLPVLQGKKVPRLIVFCDSPVGNMIPEVTIKRLKDVVKRGSHLLILGGYYSLNKGETAGTGFEELLPVICGKPFEINEFGAALPIEECPEATVSAVHLVKLREGAEVKSKVNGLPFIVSWNYGFGKVTVVTGIPSWKKDGDFANSKAWIDYMKKLF